LLLAAGFAPRAASEPAATDAPLTHIADVRALSPEQAAKGRPVKLRATVTYYHHDWEMLFVQDETAALFVYVSNRRAPFPIRLGQRVELQGRTVPGDFAPSVAEPRVLPLEPVGLPAPRAASLKDLASAAQDALWTEVRGVVRTAAPVDGLLQLSLGLDGGKLLIHVKDFEEHTSYAALVDSVVRIRGVCTTLTNTQRQFLGAELWVPTLKQVWVEQAADPDPFATPTRRLADLRRDAFGGGPQHRLHVTGTVTLQQADGLYVQDEDDGLFVQTAQPLSLHPGDRVEAVGFLGNGPRPVLEDAVVRLSSAGPPPAPVLLKAGRVLEEGHDAQLVRVRGRFVGRVTSAGSDALVVQDGDTVFDARTGHELPKSMGSLEPGSLVELTGVCSLVSRATRTGPSLELLLRGADDLVVLERPPWWTAARVRLLLEALAGVFVAALAWVALLRRRVRQQTAIIRERLEREAALEQRFALAVQGTNDGIWDWDLRNDQVFFSPRWKTMLGYDEAEVAGTPAAWFDLVHADDLPRLQEKIALHRAGSTPHFEDEHRLRHRDGSYRWLLSRGFALRDAAGQAYRLTGAQTDVTDRRSYDPLTGLANRALFVERLERAIARVRHAGAYLFAVLFLDLDRFKFVNDSLGHLAGDDLLESFARRIEGCVRPGDMVARFGGDEFAILIDGLAGANSAAHVAERIQRSLELPFSLGGHEVYASASIGIALSATGYERGEDLLRDADTAMYRAKARGRSRFEVFDAGMRERVTAFLRTENDLRRALEREELRLVYQPIVDLGSATLVAFEALVRWQHPERGLLAPDKFVEIAEETGLIAPLGQWVLRNACRQARSWQDAFPAARQPRLCVNMSARQVSDPELVARVQGALEDSGLAPERLVLEITESAIMETADAAVERIAALRELGLRLHLDDFGTGYSSLSYLHRFPIEALKIDRSFVATMVESAQAQAIVRSILGLAHNLRLAVVAEGVETEQQARLLRVLGCEQAQGFYFSPPLDAPQLEALMLEPRLLPVAQRSRFG
jgi:diguanylate cyclase (GGDEF)-like protein/PAS domain S-box-containing protein